MDNELYELVASEGVLETDAVKVWASSPFVQARFLKSHDNNKRKAAEALALTAKWRVENRVDSITWSEVHRESSTGKMYLSLDLRDLSGRPVVIMRPRNQNPAHTFEEQVRHFIYVMERAQYRADALGVGTICWLGDYSGWTLKHNPPFKMSMELLGITQRHYPCLIGNNIVINHPVYFKVLYSSLQPFISRDTESKLVFIDKNDRARKMAESFPLDELEIECGGTSRQTYVHALWGGEMLELESRQRRDVAKRIKGLPDVPLRPSGLLGPKASMKSLTSIDSSIVSHPHQQLPPLNTQQQPFNPNASMSSGLPASAAPALAPVALTNKNLTQIADADVGVMNKGNRLSAVDEQYSAKGAQSKVQATFDDRMRLEVGETGGGDTTATTATSGSSSQPDPASMGGRRFSLPLMWSRRRVTSQTPMSSSSTGSEPPQAKSTRSSGKTTPMKPTSRLGSVSEAPHADRLKHRCVSETAAAAESHNAIHPPPGQLTMRRKARLSAMFAGLACWSGSNAQVHPDSPDHVEPQ